VKLGLINSAWLGTSIDTARGIELTKKIGFDTIDIFADPLEISAQERRLIRKSCIAVGLPVVSTVCCALGIADFNQPVRAFHVQRAKAYLDLCYELEGRNLLMVIGEYIWQQEVIAPRDQWKWAVQHVRQLAEYAQSLCLEIALEIEPFHLSIVNNIDLMRRFLDDVAHPAAKANVDISHLALAGDAADKISKLAGRIAHVHLSDCDGKKHGDLPPGRGAVNFPPHLKALADAGFSGTVSIELEYSLEPDKIVDWVREAYQVTDRLMNGLRARKENSYGKRSFAR
ncbi:sugar phosphate isomerase/epimerase, partial [Alloacidobacterium sp.]|uniref:sugar phosphate isomerase/epimerase family protein n=1 Tax=Alloacidobacterium sp. TaxID=2951999 RepID=UPI002D3C9CE1